jgi:translocation and assembly module TamB
LLALLGLVLMVGAGIWYTTTPGFQTYVRRRIVAELENATGGRVELGAYHTIPLKLQVEIRDLTIHGLEAPDQVPLAHVDSVLARIKIISLLQKEFGFDALELDHPVVHLIVYPDGSTNQPEPKVKRTSTKSPMETVFSMHINQFSLRRGELLWNDQKIPLDIDAQSLSAELTYSFFRRRYDSRVTLGQVQSAIQDYRPFRWSAKAQFTFGQRAISIQSLTVDTDRSHVTFDGSLRDFSNPQIQGNYTANVNLAELADIFRLAELKQGSVEAKGLGSWSAAAFSTQGKLALKDFEYHDPQIALRDTSLNTDYQLDNHLLRLDRASGRVLGGSVSGDAEISNWLAVLAPPHTAKDSARPSARDRKAEKPEESRGLIRVRVRDITADAVAKSLGAARHFDRMRLDGVNDGTIELRWKGSPRNLESDFALNLVPPSHPRPNFIPITAHARGTYRLATDELELATLDLTTRSTQLRASGKLAENSTLQLSVSSTSLSELEPIIGTLGGPDPFPLDIQGSLNFNGSATGKFTKAAIAGRLQLVDFNTQIPATANTPAQTVHWDSFTGDLQASPGGVALRHANAQHDRTQVRFDVSASLSNWSFLPNDPFTAHVDLLDADITEVLQRAGRQEPVTGRMNLLVQASGTRAAPHADGHVHVSDAVVYGEPVPQLDTDLHWDGEEATLNNLQFTYYDAKASGGAIYNPGTRQFHINLSGTNFDLQHIPRIQHSRVLIEGRADFNLQGDGTPDAPALNAHILLRDLTFDHERAGDMKIDATTQGEMLNVTARSSFEKALFNLDGSVRLRDNFPADVSLQVDHFDADAFLHAYLKGRITGHSAVEGKIEAHGPLKDPGKFAATAEFSGLSADISNVKIHNQDPVRLTLADQTLRIEQLHLVGTGTDFTAHGTALLTGERDLDLVSQGHIDLSLLQTFDSDFFSSGGVDLTVAVTGPVANPQLQGRLNVTQGSISYAGLPSGLSEMNGSLVFNQNRMQIESLTARSGGGTLTLTGQATTYAGQISFDFNAIGQDIRLRYPAGVSSNASADLHFYGTTESSTLAGNITVNKLAITPGFDFSAYTSSGAQSVVVTPATSPLYRVKLDVHVVTAPDLQMQTAVARLSGAADLRVRGSAARPAVLGRIDVVEGEISFNGAKYRLDRGEVLFTSPVSIQPVLDLQASTRVRDYDITVSVNGQADKPLSIKYRSDPPLPEADIVALLAVGQTREESAQMAQSGEGGAFSQTASNLILSEAINATVSNRVQRLFGISKIKIDPQGLSTETNPTRGPQVTIEQQISNDFTLTYSQNVSQASQQIIQGEYYIRRNVSIVGTRDQNGVVSFDVKIRQRKK